MTITALLHLYNARLHPVHNFFQHKSQSDHREKQSEIAQAVVRVPTRVRSNGVWPPLTENKEVLTKAKSLDSPPLNMALGN